MKEIEIGVYSNSEGEYKLIFNEEESVLEILWFNGKEWEAIDSMSGCNLCADLVNDISFDMHEVREYPEFDEGDEV